ncbi:MAG: [protein-PII] uridylyltransferase [Candidatus Desulfofervidus auxilii]|nr:[protein-PII] uridylyltransferase [Candidatus Desulfofervidus auxilii]
MNLIQERKNLIKDYLNSTSGKEIVYRYTQLIDNFVKEQWIKLAEPKLTDEVALIAVGGYGRKEMSFYSDVDLLILHIDKPSSALHEVVVSFIQSFWDHKIRLDHSFRTIKECLSIAKDNFLAFMAMLTPRFLIGNNELFEELIQTLRKKLIEPQKHQILKNIWERRKKRHLQYSQHTHFLEPNLKKGIGGLRDIHNLQWAAIIAFGNDDLKFLETFDLLSTEERKNLEEALDFLWRVRNCLHYLSKHENDELSFGYQEKIAQFLGFKETENIKAVENFMRMFFTYTFSIKHITNLFLNRLLEKQKISFWKKYVAPGIYIQNNQLIVNDEKIFLKQPALLVKIYTWAAKFGVMLSFNTQRLLNKTILKLKSSLCNNLEIRDTFLEFLTTPKNLLPFLEDMTYQGLLCAIFPEWEKILHLPQHNLYHVYTTDLHAFHTINEIKNLREGKYKKEFPIFTKAAQSIKDEEIDILFLAAFFHDLGKGIGHPHQEVGAKEVEKILKRWQLPIEKQKEILWLIRYHLLLSHTAQRRDLGEEKIIIDTAQIVGNLNRLKMLYVLSFADAKASGPRAFTEWKMTLITELFLKLQRILKKGDFSHVDIRVKLQKIKENLTLKLKEILPENKVFYYLEILPPRYLLNTPLKEILFHLEFIRKLNGKSAILHWENLSSLNHYKVTIASWDAPGLFAKIAGTFSLHGFNILNAQAYTWGNKIALDTFWLNTKSEIHNTSKKWEQVERDLCRAIKGEIDLERLLENKYRPSLFARKDLPSINTEIKIDNETSDFYTIIEVYTADKPALLFKLAQSLFKLGLNIHVARISTRLDQVVDVFYVEEKTGGKIYDQKKIEEIKKTLTKTI